MSNRLMLKWHNAHLGTEQAWATTDGVFTGHEFRVFRTPEGVRLEIWRTRPAAFVLGLSLAAPIELDRPPLDDRAGALALLKAEADRWATHFCPQLRRSA